MWKNGRKNLLNLFMLLLFFWILMSIQAAFLGAARSKPFFNSIPMVIFWCVLLVLLIAGFFIYPAIRRHTSLSLIHAGCCLVLAGGLWGSSLGHRLANRIMRDYIDDDFPVTYFTQGIMTLHESHSSGSVFDEQFMRYEKLPFAVKLMKTWVDYYETTEQKRPPIVKDYKSTLQILGSRDEIIKEVTIEVNKPLYYGGYHFYQHTFGIDEKGPFSGLLVTSARGIWLVFNGYGFIFVGLVFHFWLDVLRRDTSKESVL